MMMMALVWKWKGLKTFIIFNTALTESVAYVHLAWLKTDRQADSQYDFFENFYSSLINAIYNTHYS